MNATLATILRFRKLIALAVVVGVFALCYRAFGDQLTPENIAAQESRLRAYQQAHPVIVFAVVFSVFAAATAMSFPGALFKALVCGWLFGFWQGLLLATFASTLGATAAFLLSRYLFRGFLERQFGGVLAGFNRALKREGAFYLFALRLLPLFPYFILNSVMGLTPLPARTFWWVSQLGMLPATTILVYAGSRVTSLTQIATAGPSAFFTRELVIALTLAGFLPLFAKWTINWFRPSAIEEPASEESSAVLGA